MKKIFLLIILFCFVLYPVSAKEDEKLDVNSQSFLDLGHYVETLEINDQADVNLQEKAVDAENFEDEAIIDVAK